MTHATVAVVDPSDKNAGSNTFNRTVAHRSGYGGEAAAVRERQVRAGGTMEAGEGAKLYAIIDELHAAVAMHWNGVIALAEELAALRAELERRGLQVTIPAGAQYADTGEGVGVRRRLTLEEAAAGMLPVRFNDEEWAHIARADYASQRSHFKEEHAPATDDDRPRD